MNLVQKCSGSSTRKGEEWESQLLLRVVFRDNWKRSIQEHLRFCLTPPINTSTDSTSCKRFFRPPEVSMDSRNITKPTEKVERSLVNLFQDLYFDFRPCA
jgi:hypothetical protein